MRFPKDAVIVFEYRSLGDALAPPLKLIHGLETFVLGPPGASDSYRTLCGPEHSYPSSEYPRSCILAELAAATETRPLFWVSNTARGQPRFVQESFKKLDGPRISISVPRLAQSSTRLPKRSDVYPVNFGGVVFQLDK